MADEHDVTLGEVYRLNLSMSARLTELASSMVGRNEFEATMGRLDDRFRDQESDISDLKASIAETRSEQSTMRQNAAELERKQNDQRAARTLTIVSWIAVPLLGVMVAILFPIGG